MIGEELVFERVKESPWLKSPSVVAGNEMLFVDTINGGTVAPAGADVAARPATGAPNATAPASAHATLFQDPKCIMDRQPPRERTTWEPAWR
jgi:hypothetical protein